MHPFHGAKSEIIAGAGHMVHFERPAELAAVTEAFVHADS
jgi:pimeloyl-ACP methyl ester carboxylesterase